ncbi:MAG: hypothetical protein ACTHMY_21750 [Solirubrobacteraceae bacterium]
MTRPGFPHTRPADHGDQNRRPEQGEREPGEPLGRPLFAPTTPGGRGSRDAQSLAANWWRHVLGADGRSGPQALSLDGETINPAPSPVFLIAGAAAATAAGDTAAARALRNRAATVAREDPTYYGDAWMVLGPALLERSLGAVAECRA